MSVKDINEIKKSLEAKKVVMGATQTLKKVKLGKVSKVYISSNCPEGTKDSIEANAKIAKIDAVLLKQTKSELGVVCKKPFSISF